LSEKSETPQAHIPTLHDHSQKFAAQSESLKCSLLEKEPFIDMIDVTTRKVLIDNVSKSSAKGYFSSPMGLTRRYGFCCRNCVRQSPTTYLSVRRAWVPFRHGKSDRCRSVSGSPLTADVMQTATWQTPLTGS
jgi:hypothetical protein